MSSPHIADRNPPDQGVDVTVLLATKDRAGPLARTLDGLKAQQLGGLSWEVIVVNNGSTDDTDTVLSAAARDLPLVALSQAQPGKSRALNTALPRVRGDLVVFTDDDVAPEPNWIRALNEAAGRWPEDNVFGGAIVPDFPEDAPAWMGRSDFPHSRWAFSGYHPRSSEGPTADTPLGPNMAIRSRALVGMRFDESLGPERGKPMGEEVDLLLRLWRRGEQFIFIPSARVQHVLPPSHITKANLCLRALRCGRANARLFPETSTFPVLGIGLYHWRRAAEATLRLALSRPRAQRERWLAAMEFHQVRGHILELVSMLGAVDSTPDASAGGTRRLFPTLDALRKGVRRRGLLRTAASPLAWALRPVASLRVLRLYDAALAPAAPLPELRDDLRIRVHRSIASEREVRVALSGLGLRPEAVEERLARGDSVAVAYSDEQAVGYAWCTFSDLEVTEIGVVLPVSRDECLAYDGFVLPAWRGSRVLRSLDAAQMSYAASLGRTRQIVFASGGNRSSLRSLKAMDKSEFLRYYQLQCPLLGWTRTWTREAPSTADARGTNESRDPSPAP